MVVGRHLLMLLLLLLEDQLRRDGELVEGRRARCVLGSLSGHAVVLNGGQRLERHRVDVGSEVVLHLPLQLHPPVLKPRPHLRKCNNKVLVSREMRNIMFLVH